MLRKATSFFLANIGLIPVKSSVKSSAVEIIYVGIKAVNRAKYANSMCFLPPE